MLALSAFARQKCIEMNIIKTPCTTVQGVPFPNLFLLQTNTFSDDRGSFMELFSRRALLSVGISTQFVQDNLSYSKNNVLRGLHFQKSSPQAKLVTVLKGRALDIVLDLDSTSPTYSKIFSIEIAAGKSQLLFIGNTYAHGFLSLQDDTIFYYKCSTYYNRTDEAGFQASSIAASLTGRASFIQSKKDAALIPFNSAPNKIY